MGTHQNQLKVFVSSTSEDLRDYRGVAQHVIINMGWYPVMMEAFGSIPEPTVKACQDKIKGCDVVLLLVAFRKGWVPDVAQGGNGSDSITALELAYARENNIPVLAMLADEYWPMHLAEKDHAARDWMDTFRSTLNLPAEFFTYENPAGSDSERLAGFRIKVTGVLQSHRERLLAGNVRPDQPVAGIDYFERAYETIRDGEYIPFLGPCIYGEGPLGTSALISELRRQENPEEMVCLATAAEYRERYSRRRDEFLKRLRKIITEQSESALMAKPDVFDMITQAPQPPLIVCATYDLCLENHLEQSRIPHAIVTHIVNSFDGEHNGKILMFRPDQEPKISLADRMDQTGDELVIYRPLGSPLLNDRIDKDLGIDTVVITECDHLTFLGRLQHEHTQIPTRFSRLFQRRALMFIGYGLDVWHYRLVMQVFQSIGGRGQDLLTLAVRESSSDMETLAWQRLGADLIPSDPNAFARNILREMAGEDVHA